MLVCVFLCNFAHETAGAACTRHSLRPLFSGRKIHARLARIAPRECETVSHSSLRGALATKQSILSLCRAMDCFASLAMTVLGPGASRPRLRSCVRPPNLIVRCTKLQNQPLLKR